MADTYQFDESGVKRIAKTVRRSEEALSQPRNQSDGARSRTSFWVKLGDESTDGGLYKWSKADLDNKDLSTSGETSTSGSDYTAIDANRTSGLTGDYVFVTFRGYDTDGKPRYLFFGGTPTRIRAKITDSTQDGSNKRWVYTFEEVEKTSEGYGGWTTKEDGYTGSAYNRVEDMNGSSGLYGNGVNSTNIPSGSDIQPAPNDVMIELEIVIVPYNEGVGPATEYWFSYENGVDGPCE